MPGCHYRLSISVRAAGATPAAPAPATGTYASRGTATIRTWIRTKLFQTLLWSLIKVFWRSWKALKKMFTFKLKMKWKKCLKCVLSSLNLPTQQGTNTLFTDSIADIHIQCIKNITRPALRNLTSELQHHEKLSQTMVWNKGHVCTTLKSRLNAFVPI